MTTPLEDIFVELRRRMLKAGGAMVVTRDAPGDLVLKTPWNEPGKKEPAWFAAVQIKKTYVSCHLMPLYCLPALRDRVSPPLMKRMQGKSCFNFKTADAALFDELDRLIAECAAAYVAPVSPQPH